MGNIDAAISVTFIGMGIIFFVLILLLGTIVLLNKIFPYVPPPAPEPVSMAPNDGEVVAVIQAALTHYLRRKPGR